MRKPPKLLTLSLALMLVPASFAPNALVALLIAAL